MKENSRNTLRVLLVEDNQADARLLAECLREEGKSFDIVNAARLSDALEALGTEDFDVVLLDLGLPDSFGLDTFNKTYDLFPEVPVVVLTGLDDENLASEAVGGGAQDYLVKGKADGEALARVIRYSVNRASLTRVLRENEERLRLLFECAPEPILLADPETGYLIDANPAASKLLERPLEEIRGLHQSELHPPAMAEDMKRVFKERMERFLTVGHVPHIEVPVLRSDGGIRYVEIRDELLRLGNRTVVQAILRDITERKDAEEKIRSLNGELEQRVEQLEATVRELEAFNYTVSHDLGAPLRIIDGFSRILLEDFSDSLDDDGKKYLSLIRKNAKRMKHFIADLLELARQESFKVEFREVDMKGLAESVFHELESTAPGKPPTFVLGDLPAAGGEEVLLRQVVANLISNAFKFTRTTEDARIEMGWRREGEENAYWVRDNGVGFEPEQGGKIFEVFQRAHSYDEFEGTGVGLAIVQRIVMRHGGRVWAEGSQGKGATIGFTLPARISSGS